MHSELVILDDSTNRVPGIVPGDGRSTAVLPRFIHGGQTVTKYDQVEIASLPCVAFTQEGLAIYLQFNLITRLPLISDVPHPNEPREMPSINGNCSRHARSKLE